MWQWNAVIELNGERQEIYSRTMFLDTFSLCFDYNSAKHTLLQQGISIVSSSIFYIIEIDTALLQGIRV